LYEHSNLRSTAFQDHFLKGKKREGKGGREGKKRGKARQGKERKGERKEWRGPVIPAL
jgi:hypothetical protein